MPAAAGIKLDKSAISGVAPSVYPLLGKAYLRAEGEFSYSDKLVFAGMNYSDSQRALETLIARGELPDKSVFSTEALEHALDLAALREGEDPRKARHNDDLFARNKEKSYRWLWTSTLLRTPKGWENGRYETDKSGNKKRPRDVFEYDTKIGEMLVPVGNGLVVVEVDPVTGVPSETRAIDHPHKGYYARFWFDENKPEVAIERRVDWHLDEDGCLNVGADYGRWDAFSFGGFRPVVRGSGFEIESVSSNVDVETLRREVLEKSRVEMADAYVKLTPLEFQRKYGITQKS